jgi:hypothetical protein
MPRKKTRKKKGPPSNPVAAPKKSKAAEELDNQELEARARAIATGKRGQELQALRVRREWSHFIESIGLREQRERYEARLADLRERLAPVREFIEQQKAEAKPKKPHVRVELDMTRQDFKIDEKWHSLTGERQVYFLDVLIKQAGVLTAGKNLVETRDGDESVRADKIFKSLPKPIRKIIDHRRGALGGYRIKPEYFRMD